MKSLIALILLTSSVAMADREVKNGTILHLARATAATESEASFLAQQAAIREIVVECKIPHREIKIYKKQVDWVTRGYEATVQAGIVFEDCEEGKKAKGENIARLSNPQTAKDQEAYDKYLANKLGLKEQKPFDLNGYIDGRLKKTDQKIDDLDSKIEAMAELMKRTSASANQPVVVYQVQAPQVKASKANCQAQANQLMRQAEMAAQSNFPPGNLAQGQAAIYYNQAQSILQSCN